MLRRLPRGAAPLPHDLVDAHRTDLLELARKHRMTNVRLFGSVQRRVDTASSDVDLLVAVAPDTGLLSISAFALEAEALLGLRVDVVTEGRLRANHPIHHEAVPL